MSAQAEQGPSESSNGNSQKKQPTRKGNRPSEAEIEAKRKERAEKKEREAKEKERQAKLGISGIGKDGKIPFAVREWSKMKDISQERIQGRQRVRILSWNILAQGLVRRKLFPNSDCLKWKDRQSGLTSEMISHNWDLGAFQEVDRIDVHGPNLQQSGRNYVYAKGYNDKQHGLMIAWRTKEQNIESDSAIFQQEPVASKVIFFDRESVDTDSDTQKDGKRLALSRVTRNIALFVALRFKDQSRKGPKGIIISTAHLFWHPMHAYERVRQMGIMKRRLISWRKEHGEEWSDWPLFLSGDFNDQPHSATYRLVTGKPITQHCLDEVLKSTVVHQSVDELKEKVESDDLAKVNGQEIIANGNAAQQDASGPGNEEEEDEEEEDPNEEEEGEDDQILKNCRIAKCEDALLTIEEFVQLHDLSQPPPKSEPPSVDGNKDKSTDWIDHVIKLGLQSAYGDHFNNLEVDQKGNYFSSPERFRERHDDIDWTPNTPNPHLELKSFEPMYTLYSPLFSLTLDYIFLYPDQDTQNSPIITGLLPTHKTEILRPGLPRKYACASDHIPIGAEMMI
ncbi:hypothetical protein L7F22_042262 [Adiantum nelumboides]|nr:hypothetical protein [Adiantum nelumboides]